MRIRADPIRVIGPDGSMLGVISNREAQRIAQEASLDIVEVNPKAEPPVCKIMDFGKYKYEEKKKARVAKKKQTTMEVKEVKLRPKTEDHDLHVKLNAARRFLETGNKVKFVVRFRGRELAHPEQARIQLNWMLDQLDDISTPDNRPMMEGRTMAMMVSPRPAVLQKVAQEKAAKAQKEINQEKRDKEASRKVSDETSDAEEQPP